MQLLPIIFILFSFILISCEPVTYYNKNIVNDSSHDIWIYNINPIQSCPHTTFDSVLLASGRSLSTGSVRYPGKTPDDFDGCNVLICTDTLNTKIATNDSLQLSFIINRNSNWEYSERKEVSMSSISCQCDLTITDADIN